MPGEWQVCGCRSNSCQRNSNPPQTTPSTCCTTPQEHFETRIPAALRVIRVPAPLLVELRDERANLRCENGESERGRTGGGRAERSRRLEGGGGGRKSAEKDSPVHCLPLTENNLWRVFPESSLSSQLPKRAFRWTHHFHRTCPRSFGITYQMDVVSILTCPPKYLILDRNMVVAWTSASVPVPSRRWSHLLILWIPPFATSFAMGRFDDFWKSGLPLLGEVST